MAALPAHRALVRAAGTASAAPASPRCTPKSAASSTFAVGERAFTLSGIADRIERRNDGSYAILDYKTGAARTEKQVRTGLAPQLTLEAAILRGGGFKRHSRPALGRRNRLRHAAKAASRPAKPQPIDFKDGTPDSAGRSRARAG